MSMLNDNDDGMDVGVEMSEMNPAAEAAAAGKGGRGAAKRKAAAVNDNG